MTGLQAAWGQLQQASNLILPTSDREVRLALRQKGEPQTFFGEGPFERRERLRSVLLAKGDTAPPKAAPPPPAAPKSETFYTEGPAELKEMRKAIAQWSLYQAFKRKSEEAMAVDTEDSKIDCVASVMSDSPRPLMYGRWSPRGEYLAVSGLAPHVYLYNEDLEDPVAAIGMENMVHGLAWNPGTRLNMLATIDSEGIIKLFQDDGEGWKVGSKLEGHELRGCRLDFHTSGFWLASTSYDETWRYWDLEREVLLQEGHAAGVYGCKHHPDGSLLATTDLAGLVRVWDLRTGKCIAVMMEHISACLGVDWCRQTPHILASTGADNTVRIWDMRKFNRPLAATPTISSDKTLAAHKHLVSSVEFSPHSLQFLTGSHDATARLWDANTFTCTKVLLGHEAFVTSATFHPVDPSTLYTVSFDRTIKRWRR